jgi:alpha-tubulin suppressor-like RCC1 family protein
MRSRATVAALVAGAAAAACGGSTQPPSVGAAAKLAFAVQPSNSTAGAGIAPVVAIQDASGNTVTSASSAVTVTLGSNPAGGTLSGTTTVNAVNGVATFGGLSISSAGSGYTLVASSGTLTNATSATFTIAPAAAAKLAFTGQPNDGTAGVALTPAVAVAIQDAFGNSVPSATNAVTVGIGTNPNGGTLSGTKTVSAANGVATFPGLSINKAGSGYTLVASSGALTTGTSATFAITPAAAATLVFTVQPPTFAERAQPIAPALGVAIQDAFSNTVTSATDPVTLSLGTNPGGGTVSGTTTVNASAGIATFADLIIDRSGTGYTFVAASGTLTSATSAAFGIRFVFAGVSVGGNHTCGVTIGGAAYCWGDNTNAELGDGTRTNRVSPVPVSEGQVFATVSAGGYHTCGVTTSGAAYCWGENRRGQLGDGTMTDRLTPVPVSGSLTFTTVSAGDHHTCGVTTSGAAYCWGLDNHGQLGTPSSEPCSRPGERVEPCSTAPIAVSGGLAFAGVSAGFGYTCGVTTSSAAYCWWFSPVLVSGSLTFATVSAGAAHSCGVTTGGAAYCWGDNGGGQLGDGTTTFRSSPGPVSGGLTFAAASAGAGYTCGVTTNGAAYCWGDNGFGQLGDGTNLYKLSPVPVSGGLTFAAVSAEALSFHTCGVTTGGAAYCWGPNGSGQVGDGTRTTRFTPVRVAL